MVLDTQKFSNENGEFKRKDSSFRNTIVKGGTHAPESGRYHLYVSLACPWAHRTLITRVLKGLTSIISVSVVHWHMDNKGWRFEDDVDREPLYGFNRLSQLYAKADPEYDGRYTVPVLWDKKLNTIVNNESSEILRIFNSAFNDLLPNEFAKVDVYPAEFQKEINEYHDWIYPNINNGVYKAGFATKQEPYEREVVSVFKYLDKLELILKGKHANNEEFLVNNQLSEVDIRLYTTLVRFDPVYVQHFKCNLGMLRHDYPNIHLYLRRLYWKNEAFKGTTDFEHIKFHYTKSHPAINPNGITPVGPLPNIMPLKDGE